tara:strand:+ start:267 stop:740 length:474 start_codon:yes stop_codon:yes gene_type:complete
MAIKNISWQTIEPGQIVTFSYNSKESKRPLKRTVLCINPNISYRKKNGRITKFFVGLQISVQGEPPMVSSKLQRIMSRLGGLELEEGVAGARLPDVVDKIDTARIVKQLKPFYDNFRTFNLRECKKRRVILEVDYKKIPNTAIEILEEDAVRGINEN